MPVKKPVSESDEDSETNHSRMLQLRGEKPWSWEDAGPIQSKRPMPKYLNKVPSDTDDSEPPKVAGGFQLQGEKPWTWEDMGPIQSRKPMSKLLNKSSYDDEDPESQKTARGFQLEGEKPWTWKEAGEVGDLRSDRHNSKASALDNSDSNGEELLRLRNRKRLHNEMQWSLEDDSTSEGKCAERSIKKKRPSTKTLARASLVTPSAPRPRGTMTAKKTKANSTSHNTPSRPVTKNFPSPSSSRPCLYRKAEVKEQATRTYEAASPTTTRQSHPAKPGRSINEPSSRARGQSSQANDISRPKPDIHKTNTNITTRPVASSASKSMLASTQAALNDLYGPTTSAEIEAMARMCDRRR